MDENTQALYTQYMNDLNAMQQANNNWSAEQAQIAREWDYFMSSTAHEREVADLRRAGLNPVLSAGGSGASAGSAAMAESSGSGISAMAGLMSKMLDASIASSQASTVSSVANIEKSKTEQQFENYLNNISAQFGSVKGPSLGKFTGELRQSHPLNSAFSYSQYRSGHGSSGRGGHFNSASDGESLASQILGENPARDVSQTKFDLISLILPTLANRLRKLYNHNHAFAWIMDHTPDASIVNWLSRL